MLDTLMTFAALSMAGTAMMSFLPESGLKRTTGLVIGLLTIMCWTEGIAGLLGISITAAFPESILVPTAYNVETAVLQATEMLEYQWGASP